MSLTPFGASPSWLGRLSDEELRSLGRLTDKLNRHSSRNHAKNQYYEARRNLQPMGIGIPPEVARRVEPVIGWAGTVVDVIEERLDWLGWAVEDAAEGDPLGLRAVYDDNALDTESGQGQLDALLYGTAFVRVGTGRDGEPSPLVTVHSPRWTTGLWDARARRLTSALSIVDTSDDGEPDEIVLDQRGVTITARRLRGQWVVDDRDEHGLDRIPVARLVNRPRASRPGGRSEITRAVRYYCDAAVRTVLGMEGNREFYGIPQLTLLGRGPDAFVDGNGNPTDGWRILAGHALAIDRDEDGELPDLKQLTTSSPAPFLDQVKGWAQLLAAEAAIPPTYLGFVTDNPTSADAIRAMEARLVKRAERRQTAFGRAWLEVARLALLVRDGAAPEDFATRVTNVWRDPSTPTRAAAADEVVKLVQAGILPPTSRVTLARLDLTPAEARQVAQDLANAGPSAAEMIAGALQRQTTAAPEAATPAPSPPAQPSPTPATPSAPAPPPAPPAS